MCKQIFTYKMSINKMNLDIKSHICSYLAKEDLCIIKHSYINDQHIYFAQAGYLSILRWLYEDIAINYSDIHNDISIYAAEFGHIDVLRWSLRDNFRNEIYICTLAALNGHLDVLQYALERGCESNTSIYLCAIKGGHINIMEWIHEKCNIPDALNTGRYSLGFNSTAVGCCALSVNADCRNKRDANGHVIGCRYGRKYYNDVIEKHFSEQDRLFDITYCIRSESILGSNFINCIPDTSFICKVAAENGRIEVLQWLESLGCKIDKQTYELALNNHLATI